MKHRDELSGRPDIDESQAVDELKKRLDQWRETPSTISQTHWANLLATTNKRIDEATSARALSISWAARVAIPGVVAILFFFIGLHYYYVPVTPKNDNSVASLVNMLPQEAVDSVLAEPQRLGASMASSEVSFDIFQFSKEQISDYLLATQHTQTAVESMSDSEVATLLSALDTRMNQ